MRFKIGIPNSFRSIAKGASQGMTLVEVMIASVLLAIVSLGSVAAFGNISKAVQYSKATTIASNLAQEQMQVLKQKSFNQVLVTTATLYISAFGTDVPYDPNYYPPETITEAGLSFTRYTFVQVTREDSGTLSYYGAIPDTGMKAILVSVVWQQGSGTKKHQLRNILGDINTTMSNSIFSGRVKIWPTSTAIVGAKVTVAENVGYEDTTNATGNYTVNVFPGNYTLIATAEGYFPMTKSVTVAANGTTSVDFDLVAMGSGTVRGTAWVNDHLVISQVVASTVNAATGWSQEYVEIFNPSTWTWTIASDPTTAVINLNSQRFGEVNPTTIEMLIYNTLTVGSSSYYLFANTSPVVVAGISRTADAVYDPTQAGFFPDWIRDVSNTGGGGTGDADSVGIAYAGTDVPIDVLGWSKTSVSHNPPRYESSPIPQSIGFQNGEQYVRRSSTSGVTLGIGCAYESNSSSIDFVAISPMTIPAKNTTDFEPIVAGMPAYGAYISATDGLSQVTNAYERGSPPFAEFQLTSVATGTWTVFITSASGVVEISTVIVTPNFTTMIPSSNTAPSWPVVGYNAAGLSVTATYGYVTGWVKTAALIPISPPITVTAPGAAPASASISNGVYFLQITSGTYDITANGSNQHASYISMTSQTVVVELGQVNSGINFALSQGGRIRGKTTRDGINPLAGISVIATDSNGIDRGPGISGADGMFTLVNMATGTYTVQPVLGSGEASTPTTLPATVVPGGTINVGTFTISGSFGSIRGSVTSSGDIIKTGVLIVASTTTLTAPPPLSAASLSETAYYTTNSYEDGTYVLSIRGSATPYKVYGFYTTFSVDVPSTTLRSNASVVVTAGQATTGINLAW